MNKFSTAIVDTVSNPETRKKTTKQLRSILNNAIKVRADASELEDEEEEQGMENVENFADELLEQLSGWMEDEEDASDSYTFPEGVDATPTISVILRTLKLFGLDSAVSITDRTVTVINQSDIGRQLVKLDKIRDGLNIVIGQLDLINYQPPDTVSPPENDITDESKNDWREESPDIIVEETPEIDIDQTLYNVNFEAGDEVFDNSNFLFRDNVHKGGVNHINTADFKYMTKRMLKKNVTENVFAICVAGSRSATCKSCPFWDTQEGKSLIQLSAKYI